MGQLSLEFSRYSRKIEKTDFGENLHHDFFTRVIFQGHHLLPAKSTFCTKNAFVLLKSDPTINCQSKTQLNTFFISHLYHRHISHSGCKNFQPRAHGLKTRHWLLADCSDNYIVNLHAFSSVTLHNNYRLLFILLFQI